MIEDSLYSQERVHVIMVILFYGVTASSETKKKTPNEKWEQWLDFPLIYYVICVSFFLFLFFRSSLHVDKGYMNDSDCLENPNICATLLVCSYSSVPPQIVPFVHLQRQLLFAFLIDLAIFYFNILRIFFPSIDFFCLFLHSSFWCICGEFRIV